MLYHLLYPLHTEYSVFYVFRFITFRTIYAAITALLISFILGPWMIKKLSDLQIGQSIRKLGPRITSYNVCYTKLLRAWRAPGWGCSAPRRRRSSWSRGRWRGGRNGCRVPFAWLRECSCWPSC